MIVVIDYGAGNIQSVVKALSYIGCSCVVTDNPERIKAATAAIFPGVGAFGDAMHTLRTRGLDLVIRSYVESGRPFLGICLGMQVLFESSEESPGVEGLGILKGKIRRIPPGPALKIPHIGWNSLEIQHGEGLYHGINQNPYVYFVHSYYLQAEEPVVTATTQYGVVIDASVQKENLYATQFHPEKSGALGIQMLENFKSICGGGS